LDSFVHPPVDVDELERVRAAKTGSREAFGELFDRYWPTVWRVAFAVTGRRELANDAAQDAFLKAIDRLDSFDERRRFGPWLSRIAVNRAITWCAGSEGWWI
jgi:RNA polymerase sigma-70 factor, ECF subfamily